MKLRNVVKHRDATINRDTECQPHQNKKKVAIVKVFEVYNEKKKSFKIKFISHLSTNWVLSTDFLQPENT